MAFLDSLRANSSVNPGSGIYGQPGQQSDQDTLHLVNQMKDRDMMDFQNKANFMADLSLRQEQRMRNLYDPAKATPLIPDQAPPQQGPAGQNPNVINAKDQAELDIKKKQLEQGDRELAQKGKLGEEAMNVKGEQEKLNQQKSDQINTLKQQDLERKTNEANQKLELAQQKLKQAGDDAKAQLQAHKDMAAAVEERHKLEMANMQHRFDVTSDQHQKSIDAMQQKLDQAGHTETTTKINATGDQKTVTTNKGTMVDVYGKNGQPYRIPQDKLNELDEDGTPHWSTSKPGGDDNSGGDNQ